MLKVQMPAKFHVDDINWGVTETGLNFVPLSRFYADRANGILRPNTLPRPPGVDNWRRARFCGGEVLATRVNEVIYMIADTPVFGYALFKYVSSSDDGTIFKAPTKDSVRPISQERNDIIMPSQPINPLTDLASRFRSEYGDPNGSIQPMSLAGPAPAMSPIGGGEGLSRGGPDLKTLRSELRARSYIAGYVMGNAPQLSMSLSRKKAKGTVTSNIMAKESKPSRMLAVLMSMPANCVQRNNVLASPSDIAGGMVDYANTDPREMVNLPFTVPATIAYLSVMDHSVPEYAPNVMPGRKSQWTPEEVLSESNGVSFVRLHPVQNNSANASAQDRFNFRLKSTSGRRSLFTRDNIVCLRALEHVPVKCTSEADVYNLNNIAFGAWQFRKGTENMNALQRAINECPSQIWEQKYTVNGEEVDGIGSAFFFLGSTATNPAGESIARRELDYTPWWQTGDLRESIPAKVTQIVKRTHRDATETKKEGMVTSPVYMAKDPDHKLFAPYNRFVTFIIDQGYMTRDQLYSLGTRSSKSRSKSRALTSAEQQALDYFVQQASVEADIQAVQHEASDRAVIRASKASMTRR